MEILEPVEFHGQMLTVVDNEGQPYVAMRPIVDGVGLSWPAQYRKITEESGRWGTVAIMATTAADDKEREMVCLPLRKLTGWLMTLQTSRMEEEVAERVLMYQNECDDALWDYWSKGVAHNPRAVPLTPAEALLESVQQMVDHERRMKKLEIEHRELALKVGDLAQQAAEGAEMLLALPEPSVKAKDASMRARTNQVVQGYITAKNLKGADIPRAWTRLFREFYARYSIDLKARAKNKKVTAPEIAEDLGLDGELYALAHELYSETIRLS